MVKTKIIINFVFLGMLYSACLVRANALSNAILLNEIYLSTSSSAKQSVELYNPSLEDIDISSFVIDDAQSGSNAYYTVAQNTLLRPLQCIVFESASFNFNTGSSDKVRIFTPGSNPKDSSVVPFYEYSYSSPAENRSFTANPDGSGVFTLTNSSLGLTNTGGQDCKNATTPTSTITPTPTTNTQIEPSTTPAQILTPTATPSSTTVITATMTPTIPPAPSTTSLQISEIYSYPNSNEQEWIELYNPNSFTINATDWVVDDTQGGGSSPIKISFSIKQFEYLQIKLPHPILNNSGDEVNLIDSFGLVNYKIEYDSSKQGFSYSKSQNGDEFCQQSPTPNQQNLLCTLSPTHTPTPSPTQTPQSSPNIEYNVIITEIYPNPLQGKNEWIELYNASESKVTLADWYIDDVLTSGAKRYKFSATLQPRSYVAIDITRPLFNNTGQESVFLIRPDFKIVDSINYKTPAKGKSLSRQPPRETATCETEPTPGTPNHECPASPSPVTTTLTPTPSSRHILGATDTSKSKTIKQRTKMTTTSEKTKSAQVKISQLPPLNKTTILQTISSLCMLLGVAKGYSIWTNLKNTVA